MATDGYHMCSRCIMDSTDHDIEFDEDGVCSNCHGYEKVARRYLPPESERQALLDHYVRDMKTAGRGKEYDCVIGVSGGVDSTYVAYLVSQLGLRPIAVHLDNGWDSELAVHNIEKVLKKLGIDLRTYVLDWEEFKDLQVAFLKASVPDAEIPTDHAIGAALFQTAAEEGIRYIVSGANIATEGILPAGWTYGVTDWRYIRSVHSLYGSVKLRTFPHYSIFDLIYYTSIRRLITFRVLNYVHYNKRTAMDLLESELGWENYGGKHYESIYTRFFQGYILPKKFNIDKRRAHLSTLICSGQMTREQALAELDQDPYAETLQQEDREYVVKKLGLTESEFDGIVSAPIKSHTDYPTYEPAVKTLKRLAGIGIRLKLLPKGLTGPI